MSFFNKLSEKFDNLGLGDRRNQGMPEIPNQESTSTCLPAW